MNFFTPAPSRRTTRGVRRPALAVAAVALQLFALIPAGPVLAADATLVTTDFTAPNLVGDSNVAAQPTQGPNAFLISVDYCNTGTTHALNDVVAYIGNGTTPGTFPIVTPPPGTTAYSGSFQLQIVNGIGNDATRYLGTLAPGECQMVNWIVEYAVRDSLGRPVFGVTNNIADDLRYRWNWWGSGIDAGDASIVTVSGTDTGTVRSEQSASSNKIRPAGASTTISPSSTVQIGQQLTVTFSNVDFGSAQQGFDSDGDGNFDYDLWFQPIGESSLWDPNVFRLADVEGIVTAKCGGNTFSIPVSDYTYLSGLNSYGTNCTFTGTYTYTFVAVGVGTATMSPYQEVASGSNNEKYNGDYCGDNPTASPNICVFLTSTNGGSPTIDKTVDKAYASIGENLTYSLTYTNISSLPQGGVAAPIVMLDAIPAGTSYVAGSATCPVGVDCTADFSTNGGASYQPTEPVDPATVTHVRFLIFDQVPAGGSGTATFRVRVNSGSGTLTNTASIGFQGGPILATDSASTCIECADISLAKTVSPTTGAEGGTIQYTVTVSNGAVGVPATGVVVRDVLPAGLTYVSSSTVNGSYNPGTGNWTLTNPVAVGGSSSLTITATIDPGTAGSTIINIAEVIAQNQIDSDSTPNNGIISEDDYAQVTLPVTGADLSIVKTDAVDHVAIGENIVYTLAIANAGPDTAVGVQVVDTLPAGATLVSAVPSPSGTCTPGSGAVTCSLGNIASGGSASVTVTIRMAVAGTVTNNASVSSSTPDPNSSNNQDSEDTLVGFAPVVQIVKSGPASALIGQVVTYGFAVTNQTPAGDGSPVSAVSVTDDVAGAATYLSGDSNNNGLLEVGETWLFNATHTVTITDPDPLVNVATVSGTDRDGETVSDTDTHSLDRITPGSIGDRVWEDVDGDGVQDVGEPGIDGVTVTLYAADGTTVVASTVTAGGGLYQFSGLAPATYVVGFAAPGGYVLTVADAGGDDALDSDPSVVTSKTGSVVVNETSTTSVDAGMYRPGSIGDRVWEDVDGDGVQDVGEPGIDGVTVTLYASDGTTVVASTVTAGGGLYQFSGLAPATYVVGFAAPGGYVLTVADAGGDDGLDSDPSVVTSKTAAVVTVSGDVITSVDAGMYRPATIGDFVWIDLDSDGTQDPGEPGLGGVTVTLYAGDGITILSSTVTSGTGSYGFAGLRPGSYILGFSATGWSFTTQDAGADDQVDSDAASNGFTAVRTVASGQNNTSVDAGVLPALLGDRVFVDENGNGVQDVGEPGLAGVTVELLDDSTGATLATTVTDGSGLYTFPVVPGTYRVAFTAPSGYVFTAPDLGADDALDSDADPFTGETGAVVVTAGAGSDALDAGLYIPVSLGDRVWEDANGNGIQDVGETGVEGATVRVTGAGPNGSFGDGDDTSSVTTTAGDGGWQIDGLAPGTFRVEFDLSTATVADLVFTTPNVGSDDSVDSDPVAGVVTGLVLTSGTTAGIIDAGAYVPVTVFGSVIDDLAANGIQESGDTGLAGITVELLDGAGGLLTTTTTDPSGSYRFENLAPGTYSVRIDVTGYLVSPQDQGSDDSIDSDIDSLGVSDPVTLASGETADIDGLLSLVAIISDRVWVDLDADGVQDVGEPGLSGVSVSLYADADLDGLPDGPALATTTTSGTGGYSFVVTPGDYLLEFAATDVGFTLQDQGVNDSIDSDVDALGLTGTVTVASGQNETSVDAGVLPATIGDRVWEDLDGDGVQDSGEPGLAGITVNLYASNGTTLVDSTVTDGTGSYSFSVAPGDYVVEFVVSGGLAFTTANQGGDDALDSDAATTDGRVAVTATGSLADTTVDAGLFAPATVGDLVWEDLDGDGVQDVGEPGLAGVTVNLYASNGTTLVASIVTDGTGSYSFSGLAPGDYVVEFVGPVGATLASADQGGDDAFDSDPAPGTGRISVTVSSGESDATVDAGFWLGAEIGDLVWEDLDGDGVQDPGEPGLAGVTVNLYAGTTLVDSAITGVSGAYTFSGLAPGDYVVEFVGPVGATLSAADQGGDDELDSDPAPGTGRVSVTVSSGESDASVDAGFWFAAEIGDRVWADVDGDGAQDPGEPGLAGVTVNLYAGTTLIDSTVTDAAGSYSFSVAPGSYVVNVDEATLPAGSTLTTGNEPASVTVASGDVLDTVDFGYRVPAGVDIAKTALTSLVLVGGTATFEVTVTNLGSTPLVGLVVTDPQTPGCDRPAFDLAVAGSITYTCTLTNVTDDFTNVASVAGRDVLGTPVSDSDDAAVDVIDPGVSITKTATPVQVVLGSDAEFEITVSNTGDVDLTDVTITDPLAPDCARVVATLAVGDSLTYSCTLTNVTDDFTNTASVEGTAPTGPPVTASDTADVDVISPSFTVSKTPDLQYLLAGRDAVFTVRIENTGDVDLSNLTIDDQEAVCDVTTIASLAVGAFQSVTCTTTGVADDFVNTVTVDAEDPNGDPVGPQSDDARVDVIAPALTIDKTPANQVLLQGQTATFRITVSNTGDSTITGVVVSDALASDCDRSLGDLTAGQVVFYDCTVTGVTTGFTNVAGVEGTDLTGETVTATSPDAVVTVEVPVVVIDKTPDFQQVPLGGDATFTIRVTNAGAVDLFDVTITDARTPDCDQVFATIPASGFEEYTCSATGLSADFTNIASVVAEDAAGNPASDSDSADVDVIAPAISVTKTAITPTVYAGQDAVFSVEVANIGDVDLTNVVIDDLQATCATVAIPVLAVGDSETVICTTTNVTADFVNEVTVTADPPAGPPVSATSSADVLVLVPGVSISKTPDNQLAGLNATVTFSITVTNTGATPLTNIEVTDDLSPDCDRTLSDLAPGASATFSCDSDPVTGDFTNVADVTAADPAGNPVSDSDDAFVDLVDPAISVEKTPDLQTLLVGGTASFTITVTNSGDIDLADVTVSDPRAPGCTGNLLLLAAQDSETITCSVTGVTADFTNVVTVSAPNPLGGPSLTASDDAVVDVVQPGVEIVKTTTTPQVVAGGTASFDITVTNTGDQDLVGLVVTDALAPDCERAAFILAVGDSLTYTCTLTNVTDDFTNVAAVAGTDVLGNPVSWSDDAAVDVIRPAFTVDKTPDNQVIVTGGTATFTITVANTGDVALSSVTIDDPDAVCDVTLIGSLAVGASESVTCTTTGVTADFTNVATVEAEDPNGDPVGPQTDSADVTVLTPAVGITKTPNLQQVPTGGTVTFTITVTNTGETPLTDVEVSDLLSPDCDRSFASLPLLGVETYTCTRSNVTVDFTNVALVDALDPLGNPVPQASDDAVVDVIAPAITIAKTPDLQSVPLGDPVTFTITVTNTGDVDLANATVTDPLTPDCDRTIGDLQVDGSTSYTCALDPVTASFVNTAAVTADAPAGPAVTDSDTASVTVLVPGLTLTKDPAFQTVVLGDDVTFTLTVTNTGQVDLVDVDVVDPLAPDCDRVDLVLGVGATQTWSCTLATPGADFTNVATATGEDANANPVTSTDSALVDVLTPVVSITKTALTPSVVSGQDGTFTITVSNTGQVDFVDVDVSDPALPGCDRTDLTLAVGASASWTCTAPGMTADLVNTAGVTARTLSGVGVTASSTATITVLPVGNITGVLFFDLDGDGIYEPGAGDVPLVNVDVVLVGPSGTRVVSTDVNGRYEWIGILPGVYSVTVDQTDPDLQAGVFESTTSDGQSVTVAAGVSTTAAPIGFTLLVPPTLPGPPTGSSTTVVVGTTTTTISPVTVPGTLPFTGFSLTLFLVAGLALIGIGGRLARRREDETPSPTLGGWNP